MIKINLNKREKIIFTFMMFVLVLLVVVKGIFIPMNHKAEIISKKIYLTEKELAHNLRAIQQSKDFEKEYQDILELFTQNKSDEEVRSAILSEIEAAAEQINMRITDVKPKKTRKIDFYNRFSVSLSIDGELADIIHFVHILQNTPHMFHIEELNLDKISQRSTDLRCRLILSRVLIP